MDFIFSIYISCAFARICCNICENFRRTCYCKLLITSIVLLVIFSIALNQSKRIGTIVTISELLSITEIDNRKSYDHISTCVPLYRLFKKYMRSGYRKRQYPKNSLSLVGAYAYTEYSVVTTEADGWCGEKVYCRYFDENRKELGPQVESLVFPDFVVHCCRKPSAQYMSITENIHEEPQHLVPVYDRTVDDPIYNLSLCLATFYGNDSNWLMLVELVEHYKLQGVEHFYVYIKDIDDYSRKLVDGYVRTGEAEVVHFRKKQDRVMKEWQIVSIQDCLYRSRHHSRYSIFADLDERIMTTSRKFSLFDYVSMTMKENCHLAQICFKTRAVLRTSRPPSIYEGDITLQKHLPALIFRNTSAITNRFQKCVVDTRKILYMEVHSALLFFSDYGTTLLAPSEKAILMHYRDIYADEWYLTTLPKHLKVGSFEIAGYPAHLKDQLYTNVKKRLDQTYGAPNNTF